MQAILFDLDGTLLPMDIDIFTKGYFGLLTKKAAPYGYTPQALVDGIWTATKAMVQNDGTMSNSDRFWEAFAARFGQRVYDDIPLFDAFYTHEFKEAVCYTQPAPQKAQSAVELAHAAADKVILATNPIFPLVGVETRLTWLGLHITDFDHITSYENSRFCKPNPLYYEALLNEYGLCAKDCLMVGNDVQEDIEPASAIGLQTYLLTDCMINRANAAVCGMAGTFDELLHTLTELER